MDKTPVVVETEEYAPGRFRTVSKKSSKAICQEKTRSLFAVCEAMVFMLADCIFAVITVSIVIRTCLLLYCFISSHWVAYDVEVSIWRLLWQGFWVWLDFKVMRFFRRCMHQLMPERLKTVSLLTGVIAAFLAGAVNGLLVYPDILEYQLGRFISGNHLLVAGSFMIIITWALYKLFWLYGVAERINAGEELNPDLEEMVMRYYDQLRHNK